MSTVDSRGRTIFVADAHCSGGRRFVVRADERLSAFVELEWAIRPCGELSCQVGETFQNSASPNRSGLGEECFSRTFFSLFQTCSSQD